MYHDADIVAAQHDWITYTENEFRGSAGGGDDQGCVARGMKDDVDTKRRSSPTIAVTWTDTSFDNTTTTRDDSDNGIYGDAGELSKEKQMMEI